MGATLARVGARNDPADEWADVAATFGVNIEQVRRDHLISHVLAAIPVRRANSVTRIRVMTTTTSLANVKAHLSAIVGSVHDTHERVVITRNGEPAAVLVSPDDLASLEETLDILSDNALMAQLAHARAEIDAGETVELPALRRA